MKITLEYLQRQRKNWLLVSSYSPNLPKQLFKLSEKMYKEFDKKIQEFIFGDKKK